MPLNCGGEMLILFVEDDLELASQTMDFLAQEGIDIDFASNVKQARHLFEKEQFSAVILDMNLPDGNGIELAEHFTANSPNTPILFLTGQDSIEDKLCAFSAGALDYLTKPFSLAELAVRIKLLGAKKKQHQDTFSIADLFVDFDSKVVKRQQQAVTLSPQQWQLLKLLAAASPGFVSKQQIVDTIWPDKDVTNDMYKALVSRLRTNLSPASQSNLVVIARKQGVALKQEDE